jgi:hypothetical protein
VWPKLLCTIFLGPTEKAVLKAWGFCAEKSRSIEVVYKDEDSKEEVLTRVHFNLNIEVLFSVNNKPITEVLTMLMSDNMHANSLYLSRGSSTCTTCPYVHC